MYFYTVIGFVFSILAPCGLIVGVAILLQRKVAKKDCSSLCPYIAIPIAVVSLPLIYAYGMEPIVAAYGANKFEADAFHLRILSGPYRLYFWATFLGLLSSQLFWIKAVRASPSAMAIIGLFLLLPARM